MALEVAVTTTSLAAAWAEGEEGGTVVVASVGAARAIVEGSAVLCSAVSATALSGLKWLGGTCCGGTGMGDIETSGSTPVCVSVSGGGDDRANGVWFCACVYVLAVYVLVVVLCSLWSAVSFGVVVRDGGGMSG